MKILVIPDVHSRLFWKRPLEKYIDKVDKVVFLGDYCDPYQDETTEPIEWKQTLDNFLEIIELKKNNPDKVVLLLGNHDEHYRNKQFDECARSTRYDSIHSKQLYGMFNGENYKLFQLCYSVENDGKRIIFTHAGITKFWMERCKLTYDENIQDTINNLEETAKGIGKLCVIGRARTLFGEKTGSPLWCDLREFFSDESIDKEALQIFGHTRLKQGCVVPMKSFRCVDSRTVFMLDNKNRLRRTRNEKVKAYKEHGTVQDTANDSKG